MTATTKAVRDQAFLPLECDIPAGMTLAEYRARRTAPAQVRGRRRRIVRRQFSTK
jgi:hypothetical protein